MSIDAGDALVRTLHDHNPWWEHGTEAFSLPARQKSDFYHLARPDTSDSQFEDQSLFGLVGRRGVGKTTLLYQFIHHRIEAGDDPERFLYLPFDADPLYQLQSDEQLRRAVRYYESRVLGRIEADYPHFILVDDVHQIEHPNKPTIDGWGNPVAEMLEGVAGRHIVVTASAGIQVERELESVAIATDDYDIQPILPEKFRDYLFTLYPDLEEEENRVSPTSLRTGENSLPAALKSGEIDSFVAELQQKYEKVTDDERRIQSQVVDYLAMGGTISYNLDGVAESAADLTEDDYAQLREDVRDALYQEIPGFESIQTIADLERLCALAARNRGAEVAEGDVLLFTDADTVVPPDWVDRHRAHYDRSQVVGVGGPARPLDGRLRDEVLFAVLSDWWYRVSWPLGFVQQPGFNCSVRRDDFCAIGGYDETIPFQEDTELSLRLKERGEIVYDPDCVVCTSPRREHDEGYGGLFVRNLRGYVRQFLLGDRVDAEYFDSDR